MGIADSIGRLARGFAFGGTGSSGESETESTGRVLEEWEEGAAHSEAQKGERGRDSGMEGGRRIRVERDRRLDLGLQDTPRSTTYTRDQAKGPEGAYSKMASRNSP